MHEKYFIDTNMYINDIGIAGSNYVKRYRCR
jgi:hypothetical protein